MDESTRYTEEPLSHLRSSTEKFSLRDPERVACLAAGAGAMYYGLRRGGVLGMAVGALGAALTYQGLREHETGPLHFTTGVTVNRPPEDLYQFWQGFTRLPQFMNFIKDIRTVSEGRTHWVAGLPGMRVVEWDSDVIEDVPNERISWRTVEGSKLHHEGSVRFAPAPAGRGTEVELELDYILPTGIPAKTLGGLLNMMTKEAVREDLRRFKRLMESGEIPTASRTHAVPRTQTESRMGAESRGGAA